ncbi:MAG: glycosyltransferase family 9 protein, partial [Chthoniobacteraceae bacterium]
MPPSAPRSILIIKPSSLGDIVHALPAVARVRRRWPEAKIRWLVNPEWAPVLDGNPDIDEVIEFPRSRFRGLAGWARLPGWIRELRERVQPDLTLDFQGLLRSALIARGVGGESWGTSDSRECARFFHRHIVRVPPRFEPLHAVSRYLALVAALGCDIAEPLEWRLPAGTQPPDCPRDFVLLHPFSRGEGKSLTVEEVAVICRELSPAKIVIAGRSDAVISPEPNVVNLLNKTTLQELCWLLRHAAFVASVDSGPMHIAAAV